MQAVVVDRQERHRQLLTDRLAVAEADAVEHGAGIEQAAEGADQIKEGLGAEYTGVAAGLDRGVVEVGDGALGGFVDTAGDVELTCAVAQPYGSGAAGFAARLLGAGVEVEAGGGEALLAAGTGAVEINAFAAAFRQAVVGNRADSAVATEQLPFGVLQRVEQLQDAARFMQRLIQVRQGRCGQG